MILDHIAAGVLYLLWKRRRNDDGSLVPAKILREELLLGAAGVEYREKHLGIPAVKKKLRELKAEGMVEYGESKKVEPLPGPAPQGYRFSAEAPIITWRATAAIVMMLRNHRESRLRREDLIAAAFKLGVTHHNREGRLNAEEISELVTWCVRKEYITEVKAVIDETSTPTVERRLTTTSKVDDYELFLTKIAAEVKHQAASEESASTGGEELRKGG